MLDPGQGRASWSASATAFDDRPSCCAVFNTSTANVVFILAFTSMFAAILSWIFLEGAALANATLVTMAGDGLGVGADRSRTGLPSGHIFGDVMAACSAFPARTGAITLSRAARIDMGFVPLVATIYRASFRSFLRRRVLILAGRATLRSRTPAWIMFNGRS